MTVWWFAALALLAVVFVLWPLLKKQTRQSDGDAGQVNQRNLINDALYQEQFQELQQDLNQGVIDDTQFQKLSEELRVLHDGDVAVEDSPHTKTGQRQALIIALVSALLIPLVAGLIYWRYGSAADWKIQQIDTELTRYVRVNGFDKRAETMIQDLHERLQQRLKQKPDNLNNWYLLANTEFQLGNYLAAIEAYKKILERRPNSPGVMANLVQVMYIGSGSKLTPPVKELFDKALAADPQNATLLGIGGADAYQQGRFADAVGYWQRALQAMKPRDPNRAIWEDAIAQARSHMTPDEAAAAASDNAATSGPAIDVAVSLADHVQAEATDRVFVFARAWQGAPMPLAVAALTVADLPTTVHLDKSNSMMGNSIQSNSQVELVARISSTGTQAPKSGEWEATAGPITVGEDGVSAALVIQSQRP